jgi:hypothetical protein
MKSNKKSMKRKLNKQKANKRKREKKLKEHVEKNEVTKKSEEINKRKQEKKAEVTEKNISKLSYLGGYMNKLKWHGYLNKCKHEERILKKLKEVYGEEAIFIIGDWSQRDGIKGMPTIGIGFKRLLEKEFKVYLIDEYGTSKTYYKLEKGYELKHARNEISGEEIYSVLTCKMDNGTKVYVNRDRNAVKNMLAITGDYIRQAEAGIEKLIRIPAFRRAEIRSEESE